MVSSLPEFLGFKLFGKTMMSVDCLPSDESFYEALWVFASIFGLELLG